MGLLSKINEVYMNKFSINIIIFDYFNYFDF